MPKDRALEIHYDNENSSFNITDQKTGLNIVMFTFNTEVIDLDYEQTLMLVSLVKNTIVYDETAQMILNEHLGKLGSHA